MFGPYGYYKAPEPPKPQPEYFYELTDLGTNLWLSSADQRKMFLADAKKVGEKVYGCRLVSILSCDGRLLAEVKIERKDDGP